MKTIKISIEGVSPLIMHNGQLADRRCPYVAEIKRINAKKTKRTEEDFERLERLEWEGGLWLHEGKPCIPADVVHALVISGARKTRGGKDAQSGVWCDEPAVIRYSGPTALDDLYADARFVDSRGVRINKARIIRTRPIFREWGATLEIVFDPKQLDESTLREWIVDAGEQVGIGDYRPRFGRFVVV